MTPTTASHEIGRELTADELQINKVVVIKPPGHNVFITMWVTAIDEHTVVFHSATLRWTVINFRKDGKIVDDQNREVHVFQYLGRL